MSEKLDLGDVGTHGDGESKPAKRIPITKKPRPKSRNSDNDLIASDAIEQDDNIEQTDNSVVPPVSTVSNDEILTRLTAIENQLESTNQFLGAIDWKMWLYLKAENYIDD
jgi:hypothetical protein